MNKISYNNMKLKVDVSVNTFDFNGEKIEVLKYLPIESKYDLVMITLQKAEEDGVYNPLKLEMYFNLHLVYMYSNLSFTEKQKENEAKIYDTLESCGFISQFLDNLEDSEYEFLCDSMDELIKYNMSYKKSTASIIRNIIQDLPKSAQAAADIVESFDREKFQNVIDFANAANGNRNFITNEDIGQK